MKKLLCLLLVLALLGCAGASQSTRLGQEEERMEPDSGSDFSAEWTDPVL